MHQTKEQKKTPEENTDKTEINNLSNKEFKETIIKMLNKLKSGIQ